MRPSPGAPRPSATRVVELVYFNAGGGHRASALALEAAIERHRLPWTVRLVNLRELLDPKDRFRSLTGVDPEDLYNLRLARGWTLGLQQELKLLQRMIRWAHATLVRRLQQHWLATEPDLVVSLIPNFNRALCASLASALPGVPFVTVLTDLADHPPRFWIEKGIDQHVVCGSSRALQQARTAGCAPGFVHATSGMILRSGFHNVIPVDRVCERERLGLDAHRPTGLVLFGGQGSKAMLDIARRLPHVQLIFVCGHNATLAESLRAVPTKAPRHVMGFTPDIAGVMQLADFFIGKPGPGSLSEAVQMELPVIVVRNRWTLPQERYNVQWVREQGVGLVLPSFARIASAVDEMIASLPRFRAATRRVRNRAAFEVPVILQEIMARSDDPSGASRAVPAWSAPRTPPTGLTSTR